MKSEFDKLFESHYGISQEDLLNFDSLCNLIEKQIKFVKSGDEEDILQEAEDYSKTQLSSLMSEIPDIPISEIGFGDVTTTDSGYTVSGPQRSALKRWTDTLRGNTLPKTLRSLSEFYEGGFKFQANASANWKIRTILSYLIFYKTLTRIITGFNAASAGFTFEAFLATAMGGTQIPTGNKTIADLTDGAGTHISLKLYAEASVKVDGSWTDLVNDLADGPGYMHYVVVMKNLQGSGLDQEGSLNWYRFNFNLSNVMSILSNTKSASILQLPLSFINDPNEGDVNLMLPKQADVSIEELENMFGGIVSDNIERPELVKRLLDTLDWAKSRAIYYSKGGYTPGRSEINPKKIRPIFDVLVQDGLIEASDAQTLETIVVNANLEVMEYSRSLSLCRSQEMAQLEFASLEDSVEFYNELKDPEVKKRALKNTRGYLYTDQFHMSRTNVYNVATYASENLGDLLPDGQSDVFLQEIKIGNRQTVEMLQRAKEEINGSIFEIISSVKVLKTSLDQYFAGGLSDDKKAQTAIDTSQEIEGKTKEIRADTDKDQIQMSLPRV